MKTLITLSLEEATNRLQTSMSDDVPFSENDVTVEIRLPVVQTDNLPIQQTSKIALIKLVRALAEDLRYDRVTMTGMNQLAASDKYFGLGDAKAYVEKYLKDNTYTKF